MARRVPNPEFRTFSVTLEDAPPGLTEDMIKTILEGAVKDMGKVKVTKPKTVKLRNRNIRKTGGIPCTYTETIGGKKVVGCGRVFATPKGYNLHMDHTGGTFADVRRWPHHCLDAILPPDLRDDR